MKICKLVIESDRMRFESEDKTVTIFEYPQGMDFQGVREIDIDILDRMNYIARINDVSKTFIINKDGSLIEREA